MRKRFNLVFILTLGLILLFALVACNQSAAKPSELPSDIGGSSSSGKLPADASAGLKFTFPIEMSSVFNSIYVDDFKLSEYVHYSEVYYSADGAVLKEIPRDGVKESMIAEEDKPLLKTAGHHIIHVTAELDNNKTASGVFELHLKNRGAISLAKYTFYLEDINEKGSYAYPYFGTMNTEQTQVTVSLEKGVTFNSWEEFTRTFQMHVDKRALLYVNAEKAGKRYSATNFSPLTVGGDETFRIAFTDDVVNVTYDINLPENPVLKEGVDAEHNPENVFAIGGTGKYGKVTAQRSVGYAEQPSHDEINLYHGYTFAGWFNKANGLLFRFSNTVGTEDLHLEAHWVLTEYSFTVYTMGGTFPESLKDYELKINGHVVTEENASNEGINMNLIQSTSRFSLSTKELNRITFTGFKYDMDYEKCVAMVTVNSKGDRVMLKLSDIYNPKGKGAMKNVLIKGAYETEDGKTDYSFDIDELYSDYQCLNKVDRKNGKVNDEQSVTYVKWKFAEPTGVTNKDELYLNRISNYITNVAFKGGYTAVAGGIRLDQINDWTLNELIIPAEIKVYNKNDKTYETLPVIEIGERAISNSKAITKLDLSRAANLTTVGTEAFVHDIYLADIAFPELAKNNIKNIGDRAFYDTAYEDKFAENHYGAEFIVIGTMIYKYVGEDKNTVDLLNPSNYYKPIDKVPENIKPEDKLDEDGKLKDDQTIINQINEQLAKYNEALSKVTSIEAGAFSLCDSLETLKLPYTLTTIRNNALAGLENFTTLEIMEAPKEATAAEGDEEGGETPEPTEPSEPAEPTAPDKISLLLDIGETAFDGTPFLSESGNLYVPEAGAIIIGNVYYRFLDKNAAAADIPAKSKEYVITHIAPQAFAECAKIEGVTFGNQLNIVSIGKNAFTETAILRLNKENEEHPTLYTVYNHILTDYYGNVQDPNGVDLVIPDNVYKVATNAFGQYGRYFETVQIGASVKRIENYAFSGANMLNKVILTGVSVEKKGEAFVKLADAPSIGEFAFADAGGELRRGMKIYFNEDAMKLLNSYAASGEAPADGVTAEWVNLFKLHKDVFEAEGIDTVTIDGSKIASVLLQTTPGTYQAGEPFILPFTDTYGESVADALVITSKTNVTRYDSLSVKDNKLTLILLQDPKTVPAGSNANCYVDANGVMKYDYSNLWEKDWSETPAAKHYVLYYTYYDAPDKCMIKPDDEVFIVTVYEMIGGKPGFNDLSSTYKGTEYESIIDNGGVKNANDYIKLDETAVADKTDNKFWFTGIDGQIENRSLPTYYTSYPAFRNGNYSSVVFHYFDVNGVHRTIGQAKLLRIDNLITTAEGSEFTAYIDVDFYGIGTFSFKYSYSVAVSRYKAIEQTKTINIPVNANASDYMQGEPLNLVGEDGNVTPVNISSKVFFSIGRFDTATLGMHEAVVEYTKVDALEPLTFKVCFTVVLEANEDMFTYAILKDPFDGEQGEAAIIGFNSKVVSDARRNDIATLVLPSKCTITARNLLTGKDETNEYKITQLGAMTDTANGIFEGMQNLTAVYLPESLECIGVGTFAGCKKLRNIYTAIQASASALELDKKEYFTPFGKTYAESIVDENGVAVEWTIQPVKLTSVGELDKDTAELIIASDYKLSDLKDSETTDGGASALAANDRIIYRIVAVEIDQLIGLSHDKIDVYLPDTIFYPCKIKDKNSNDVTPFFYKSGNNFMIKTENYMPANLVTIGNSSFSGCTSLETIDLTHAISLTDIGAMAFSGSALKEIDLSGNTHVTEIHSGVFDGCSMLEKIVLHSGITSIGASAFKQCYALRTLEGKLNNLGFIGAMAFGQAYSLTRFDLYNEDGKLHTVQDGAFAQCLAITIYCHFGASDDSWNIDGYPIVWDCDTNEIATDNCIYYIDKKGVRYALNQDTLKATVVKQAATLGGDIVIPDEISYKGKIYKVAAIADTAFAGNAITSVTVSSELKTIGSYAFKNCTELILFSFSDSNGLEIIKTTAFDGCPSTLEKPQIAGVAIEDEAQHTSCD